MCKKFDLLRCILNFRENISIMKTVLNLVNTLPFCSVVVFALTRIGAQVESAQVESAQQAQAQMLKWNQIAFNQIPPLKYLDRRRLERTRRNINDEPSSSNTVILRIRDLPW